MLYWGLPWHYPPIVFPPVVRREHLYDMASTQAMSSAKRRISGAILDGRCTLFATIGHYVDGYPRAHRPGDFSLAKKDREEDFGKEMEAQAAERQAKAIQQLIEAA